MDADRPRPTAARLLVAAAALWGLFLALDRLASGRWWPWLLVDLAPPLLFPLVPALLLACALTRRARPARTWLPPVLVLLLLAGVPQAGLNWSALSGDRRESGPAGAVRVFSWNTEYWDTEDDPDAFYRYLRDRDADVYLLQEYLGWVRETATPIDELARIRREFPGYQVVVLGELVTLSRYPVRSSGPVGAAIAADAPWQQAFERGKVLRTDVEVRGRLLSFYNVHIPVQLDITRSPLSSGFYRTVRARDAARREHFAALERDAAANPHPVLISGDFNTTPAMGDLRALRAAFRDALPASGSFHPGTWGVAGPELWRLDWTFTNDRLAVRRYGFTDPAGLSDHRGQQVLVVPLGRV